MSTPQQSGQAEQPVSNLQRDPDDWKTGEEPMTAAQDSYLRTLAQEAGESVPDQLTKAEAAKRIDALRAQVGRVAHGEQPAAGASLRKDPDQWKTGEEPMTEAQDSYLRTLAQEAGESVPDQLTKAEAAKRIESLQQQTGRGQPVAESHRKGEQGH